MAKDDVKYETPLTPRRGLIPDAPVNPAKARDVYIPTREEVAAGRKTGTPPLDSGINSGSNIDTPVVSNLGTSPMMRDIGKLGLGVGKLAGQVGAGLLGAANDIVGYGYGQRSQVVDRIVSNFDKSIAPAPTANTPDGTPPVNVPVAPTTSTPAATVGPDENQPFPGGVQYGVQAGANTATPPTQPKWWEQNGWGMSGKEGKTPSGEYPTAVRKTVGPNGVPLLEARGVGELAGGPPQKDIRTELEELVNSVMKIPGATKDGVLRRRAFPVVAGLAQGLLHERSARGVAQIGLEGDKLKAGERNELTKLNLDEKIRHNQILEKDYNLRREQQKDITSQKALDTSLSTWGYHESDPMNPGNKVMNRKLTYFNMAESGEDIPSAIKPAVEKVKSEFEDYYKRGLAKGGGKDTPAERAKAKSLWMRKNLIFATE